LPAPIIRGERFQKQFSNNTNLPQENNWQHIGDVIKPLVSKLRRRK
jgi:hypothetical protein